MGSPPPPSLAAVHWPASPLLLGLSLRVEGQDLLQPQVYLLMLLLLLVLHLEPTDLVREKEHCSYWHLVLELLELLSLDLVQVSRCQYLLDRSVLLVAAALVCVGKGFEIEKIVVA